MATKPVSYYQELIESELRKALLSNEAQLIPPLVRTAITRDELARSPSALELLTANGADKNTKDNLIIRVIGTVMTRYQQENAGGLFKGPARHSGLAHQLVVESDETYARTISAGIRHLVASQELEERTTAIQQRAEALVRIRDYPTMVAGREALLSDIAALQTSSAELLSLRDNAAMIAGGTALKGRIESGVTASRFNPEGNYANLCRAIVQKFDDTPGWEFSRGFKDALQVEAPHAGPRP